jgi:hypothetical protein
MSVVDPFPHFSAPCKRSFAFLIERYGFTGPHEEQMGHERVIRYQKNDRFVSVSFEPLGKPVVEFFTPTLAPTNRLRLSRPTSPLGMTMPKPNHEWTESEVECYLRWCAAGIETHDRDFIAS